MPKVFERDGYAVYVFTRNAHPPWHVHVKRAGANIPILLTLRGAVWRGDWKGRRPREREIQRATEIVTECLTDVSKSGRKSMKRAADMTEAEIRRKLDNPPPRIGPYALSVRYAPSRDEVVLVLDTRVTLAIPRTAVSELRELPKSQLKRIELFPGGDAVAVESADVHISVRGLVRDMIGLDRIRPAMYSRPRAGRKVSAG